MVGAAVVLCPCIGTGLKQSIPPKQTGRAQNQCAARCCISDTEGCFSTQVLSVGSIPLQNGGEGFDQDTEVESQRAVFDVENIQSDTFLKREPCAA
jgi:hypothetical protein